jgi:folate-binding protein YgfZ
MEAGIAKAGPDLNEEIVPPEANLEEKAFSLSKGCYPGQEVVARMDTYGTVRRHLVGLVVKGSVVPPKGAKLFTGDREVGWISSASLSHSDFRCAISALRARRYRSRQKAHAMRPRFEPSPFIVPKVLTPAKRVVQDSARRPRPSQRPRG